MARSNISDKSILLVVRNAATPEGEQGPALVLLENITELTGLTIAGTITDQIRFFKRLIAHKEFPENSVRHIGRLLSILYPDDIRPGSLSRLIANCERASLAQIRPQFCPLTGFVSVPVHLAGGSVRTVYIDNTDTDFRRVVFGRPADFEIASENGSVIPVSDSPAIHAGVQIHVYEGRDVYTQATEFEFRLRVRALRHALQDIAYASAELRDSDEDSDKDPDYRWQGLCDSIDRTLSKLLSDHAGALKARRKTVLQFRGVVRDFVNSAIEKSRDDWQKTLLNEIIPELSDSAARDRLSVLIRSADVDKLEEQLSTACEGMELEFSNKALAQTIRFVGAVRLLGAVQALSKFFEDAHSFFVRSARIDAPIAPGAPSPPPPRAEPEPEPEPDPEPKPDPEPDPVTSLWQRSKARLSQWAFGAFSRWSGTT
jgi:hypothetical protein